MNEAGSSCPVCRVELSIKNIDYKYDIQFCPNCRREYFDIQNKDDNNNQKSEYDDIEIASADSDSNDGPVLISDNTDNRFFPKNYRKEEESYLQKYFENATITTEEYIPTETE